MNKIRISAVKYANTYPFIFGLIESGFYRRVILETDHPADCAAKLISGKVDIGLIPVAVLPLVKEYHIISDYCIGANGNVKTVMLLSNCPFEEIGSVYLDYRSRSSVILSKVLAKNSWKKEFRWFLSGISVLSSKTVSDTKLIWQWNGKNSLVFLLSLLAGLQIRFLIRNLLKNSIMLSGQVWRILKQ
jgi:predicted solute-binding protein